jgi:hypothetical protein
VADAPPRFKPSTSENYGLTIASRDRVHFTLNSTTL